MNDYWWSIDINIHSTHHYQRTIVSALPRTHTPLPVSATSADSKTARSSPWFSWSWVSDSPWASADTCPTSHSQLALETSGKTTATTRPQALCLAWAITENKTFEPRNTWSQRKQIWWPWVQLQPALIAKDLISHWHRHPDDLSTSIYW